MFFDTVVPLCKSPADIRLSTPGRYLTNTQFRILQTLPTTSAETMCFSPLTLIMHTTRSPSTQRTSRKQCITTDQGCQFESQLFQQLADLSGAVHLRTTAHHLASNGFVELLHRQLKAAIRSHETEGWVDILPTILLCLCSAWKEDLQTTSAELAYGEPLRLQGDFLSPPESHTVDDQTNYVDQLRQHMQSLRPQPASHHGA
ncbi:uncharacterized protein LOC124171128 [Ischnura elegans]|uniref:uncharacterized protein LOC124171128 n=1 Tax=Ischnura elegans TaxID=197161 RepID=UPI001ED8B9A0|nr:uncharacterized protein LOC124171128 [Ischnura elegans]